MCRYPSIQVHEVGHCLGLDHSGIGNDKYADESGFMGYGTDDDDSVDDLRCFNGPKVS